MPRTKANERIDHEHALTGEKLGLMAVFARPEEEVLGPAGTLARYASEGVRVSMVTVSREAGPSIPLVVGRAGGLLQPIPREQSCSCLAHGTQRICMLDYPGAHIALGDLEVMEERLVRMIREQEPQVVVTYSPEGLGVPEHSLISEVTTYAFHSAGDPHRFAQHLLDGLTPFQPAKLYYTVLPATFVERWKISGLSGVPDSHITTVLDVADYAGARDRTLYCQRNHDTDSTGGNETGPIEWKREYFVLAASNLMHKPRHERDLFAGLR